MAVVLVTGMSGAGKSTTLNALRRRGYRVVDTDHGDWTEVVPGLDGGEEPQWREDLVDVLISEHERSGRPLVIAGTVWNQRRFHPRFDDIVLLSAPVEVLLERVAHRDTDDFGKTAGERDRIGADTAQVEPVLRASATVEPDTREPLSAVVDRLAALAGPVPPHR
ncbi:AAA family ATPase [Actinosynnema sp. NPDC023587]|uniref:AAA family ATPase n=1 Tax=Actinosynnema sp. NPDC023587 TaxID=3154695 RepID=UPI0033C066FA